MTTHPDPAPDLPADLPQHWPHRAASRRVIAAHQHWHVQDMAPKSDAAPTLLLIHGAGGSLHSWADLAPMLAVQYRVIAVDVAGHGFSQKGRMARAGLEDIAADIAALAADQGWQVQAVIGHSAGAAIALRLAELLPLRAVIGLNAALSQFEGMAGWLFPAMAKTLSLLPFAPHFGAKMLGTPAQIDRLLAQTGAQIGAAGRDQYLTLARRPAHVGATLDMMAAWDLRPLLARLSQITVPVLLLTGARDGAVPPRVSVDAARSLPVATAQVIQGYGHLLPEEAAGTIAPLILDFLKAALAKAA
jgi:magnesium chelatase accessory protein